MDISIFLAKLFGIYLVIVGLAYFFRREFMRSAISDFFDSPALLVFSAAINLILGLLIVLSHNVWELSWKVIITIIGYLSLLKGIVHLYAPEMSQKLAIKMTKNDVFVYSGVISLALGVYLIYHGFSDVVQTFFPVS